MDELQIWGVTKELESDFKSLAGISSPKRIFTRRVHGRGMKICGETGEKGIIYESRMSRNTSLSGYYGCESIVTHSIRPAERGYPQIELKICGYQRSVGRIKDEISAIYDFVNDFESFTEENKSPRENFADYFDFMSGEILNTQRLFERRLVDLKDSQKGILFLNDSKKTRKNNDYLKLIVPYPDQGSSDYRDTACKFVGDKDAKDSKELKRLFKPFTEDLGKII